MITTVSGLMSTTYEENSTIYHSPHNSIMLHNWSNHSVKLFNRVAFAACRSNLRSSKICWGSIYSHPFTLASMHAHILCVCSYSQATLPYHCKLASSVPVRHHMHVQLYTLEHELEWNVIKFDGKLNWAVW